MNFKKWLNKIEEASGRATVNRPTATSVVDRSALYGLAAQFGHSGTQLPVSMDYKNKAVTSLAAGIGSSINKEFERSGRNISAPPNIGEFPSAKDKSIRYGMLPLQLPKLTDENGQTYYVISSFSGDLLSKVSQIMTDPLKDSRVVKIGEKYTKEKFMAPDMNDYNDVERSKSFTRALIQQIIYLSMSEQDKSKYNFKKPKVESEAVKDGNLIVVFSFPRTKDISDEIGDIK